MLYIKICARTPCRHQSQNSLPCLTQLIAWLYFFHISHRGFVIKYSWQIQRSKWAKQVGWVGQLTRSGQKEENEKCKHCDFVFVFVNVQIQLVPVCANTTCLCVYKYNLAFVCANTPCLLCVQIHLVSLDSRTLGKVWKEEEGKKECKGREGVG